MTATPNMTTHAATSDHENSLPGDTRIMDCDSLVGRMRDICRGHDDAGNPVLTVRKCNAYRRSWGLDDLPNAKPTPKVHAAKAPTLLEKAVSLTKAVVKHARDGFRNASPEEQESRLVICRDCENYEPADGSCRLCGCCMNLKKRLRTSSCPIGKWGVDDGRTRIHTDPGADPPGVREDPRGVDGAGDAQTGAAFGGRTRQAEIEGVAPG